MKQREVIVLIATLDCNLKCKFCKHEIINNKFDRSRENMSVETAKTILSQHSSNAYIVVTGGEPFLNQELLEYLFSLKRSIKIHTNGSILLNKLNNIGSNITFVISENGEKNSPLLNQLLENRLSCRIQANLYLDNPEQTEQKIIRLLPLPIKGYKVSVDFWTDIDIELEKKIFKFSSIASKYIKYNKDIGYKAYWKDEGDNNCVIRYDPFGNETLGLYAACLPLNIQKIIKEKSFIDKEIFLYGKEKFKKGEISNFKQPTEYYHCLMYELMKENYESN